MNNLIEELVAKELIFKCHDPRKRYNEEERSLEKCSRQPGYLSLYNSGIRFCFLLLLKEGYDIKGNRVHTVFKHFIIHFVKTEECDFLNIIRARHLLKYNSTQPTTDTIYSMNKIILELQSILNTKNHVYSNGKSNN